MADEHLKSIMDNLYWWGIPTLFRCPNQGPEDADIALVGVPHSTGNGTTERDQHLGPRALRNVSSVGRRMHGEFQLDPWSAAKIVDVGDVPFPRANDNEDCIEQITRFSADLMRQGRGRFPWAAIIPSRAVSFRLWDAGPSRKANQSAFCISTHIPTYLLKLTISLALRNQPPIGAPTWLIREKLTLPIPCRLDCAAMLEHSTGYSHLTTTGTTS